MAEPRPKTEHVEALQSGITWKRFVLDLPVGASASDARQFVPILDDPAGVFASSGFDFLCRGGRVPSEVLRELGRALASSAKPDEVGAFLDGLARVGLGHLDLATQGNGRYRFTSHDLRLAASQARAPSCSLVLGFCEGIIERLTGQTALGSEVTCRSMGHESCTFQVSVRS